mmetsp:Transcript_46279/g.82189  ORF Transcript_46279/g.82189 Transcript_46279/m.82189 type:complete len:224 (-) Transcript_46279:1158-1829(-)
MIATMREIPRSRARASNMNRMVLPTKPVAPVITIAPSIRSLIDKPLQYSKPSTRGLGFRPLSSSGCTRSSGVDANQRATTTKTALPTTPAKTNMAMMRVDGSSHMKAVGLQASATAKIRAHKALRAPRCSRSCVDFPELPCRLERTSKTAATIALLASADRLSDKGKYTKLSIILDAMPFSCLHIEDTAFNCVDVHVASKPLLHNPRTVDWGSLSTMGSSHQP